MSGRVKNLEYKNEMKSGVDGFILFGKLELQFPKKGIWNWDRFVCGFFFFFFSPFLFFNILYHLKTAFSSSHHIRILKSKEFPYSSFGIGGIFFHSLPSIALSAHFIEKKLRMRAKEATEKHGHLIMKARKKRPIWRANTRIYTHHTLIQYFSFSLSLSLSLSFLFCMEILSQPHLIIWSWFF